MDCEICGWPQYPTFLGYGPSCYCTCGEVYVYTSLERGLVGEPDFMLNQSSLTQV